MSGPVRRVFAIVLPVTFWPWPPNVQPPSPPRHVGCHGSLKSPTLYDYIDPNAARAAMLAGEDHTYEYQDIDSSPPPDGYGLISNGAIGAGNQG